MAERLRPEPVTVGLDVGTSSVKAVAADSAGRVLARSRVPHRLLVPAPDRVEHDPAAAWWRGARRAFAAVAGELHRHGRRRLVGVAVTGMVPSLAAVRKGGRPVPPGLLYGDARGGRHDEAPVGEAAGFLAALAAAHPDAAGFFPAQAVAMAALGGPPALSTSLAYAMIPLFDGTRWDAEVVGRCGASVDKLPSLAGDGEPVGTASSHPDRPLLSPGAVDAWCEQLVSGVTQPSEALVILGSSLVVWILVADPVEAPGLWSFADPVTQRPLVAGVSNAGGFFLDWALARFRSRGSVRDPRRVPVWCPYVRGERTPYHDPGRRASLFGLDLTHDAAAVRRAALEAVGFVVRHHLELAGVPVRRIVATGGGTKNPELVQALADCTGRGVEVAPMAEGAALGAAFLARVAAGLAGSPAEATAWARPGRLVEPDPAFAAAAEDRYRAFLEASGAPAPGRATG